MKTIAHQTRSPLQLALIALALGALMSGCVVHDGGSYQDEYYTESSSREYEEYEAIEEYEEYEEIEEYEEVTTTTTSTTTTSEGELPLPSPAEPSPLESEPLSRHIFEEGFEGQRVLGGSRMPVDQLSRWMIEWSELSACEGSRLVPTVELQRDEVDLDEAEVEGTQHVRLDAPCGLDFSPVSITTSLEGLEGARTLRFYARAADSIDAIGAGLSVIWGDEIVMDEPLEMIWMEYEIDLSRLRHRSDAILSLMATGAGVIIDHIRVD